MTSRRSLPNLPESLSPVASTSSAPLSSASTRSFVFSGERTMLRMTRLRTLRRRICSSRIFLQSEYIRSHVESDPSLESWFLDSGSWSVSKAHRLVLRYLTWRESYRPDSVASVRRLLPSLLPLPDHETDSFDAIDTPFLQLWGRDVDGYPILWFHGGRYFEWLASRDYDQTLLHRQFRLLYFGLETLISTLSSTSSDERKITVLIDASNVPLTTAVPLIREYSSTLRTISEFYPSILHRALILRSGFVLRSIFQVAKRLGLLYPETVQKYSLKKGGRSEIRKVLCAEDWERFSISISQRRRGRRSRGQSDDDSYFIVPEYDDDNEIVRVLSKQWWLLEEVEE